MSDVRSGSLTNLILGSPVLVVLHGVIQNQVHEWVEATEDSLDLATAVDPQTDPLVHELLQLRGVSLGHLGG